MAAVEKQHGIPVDCSRDVPTWLVLLDNLPTISMFYLGALLLLLVWWPLAFVFFGYCALSIVLFWGLICPYCHHFDTKACPCGYGVIAPRFFKFKGAENFAKVFKTRIAVVFPAWIVPPVAAIYLLIQDYTNITVWGIFIAYAIIGFILIPAISKFVGCRNCEIKDQCPWMT
jgi:hypothetical protein